MKKEKIHNKLVRDKIPQIISEHNVECFTRILNNAEYLKSLNAKLKEEVDEFLQSNEESWLEELADVLEVMRALLAVKGISFDDLEIVRKEKLKKRGGFAERIFLEKTKEK
jgi:predicted house-cleaning noncanonical NTP pyrophosphatase (MazG superfamily)